MRKTTEELWKQALAEQTVDSDVPETFRRLCIENELECAEAKAFIDEIGNLQHYTKSDFKQCKYGGLETLFTFPPAAIDRDSVIEECAGICDRFQARNVGMQPAECAGAIRALKSQPAAPDPRDEVIRLARVAIDAHLNPCGCFNGCEFCNGKATLSEALSAIDKVIGEK